jgi:gliding motility-associated-like protein
LQGNETGLIGYWNFDELDGNTLLDKSPKGFHGELKGNPVRVYSGAPVGDESVYQYSNSWTGVKVIMESGADKVEVSNINGTQGLHIYKVNYLPSQTNGLDLSKVSAPYFGVFATTATNYTYDFNYTVSGGKSCKYYSRDDNAMPTWSEKEIPSTGETERMEVIKAMEPKVAFDVDLGPDEIACDVQSKTLMTDIEPTGKEFLWSTGETSPWIIVNESGLYSVSVTEGCAVERDTVAVSFMTSPQPFSLGEDEVLCEFRPRTLKSGHSVAGYNFAWQDDSSDPDFIAQDFGLYWLTIRNQCGATSDSVRFTRAEIGEYEIPNIITPNGDDWNENFILHPMMMGSSLSVFNRWGKLVFSSLHYQNNWDGGNLPPGVYFYTLSGNCLDAKKGTVRITR